MSAQERPSTTTVDQLVRDLTAVRPLRRRWLVSGLLSLAAAAIIVVAVTIDLRPDVNALRPSLVLGSRSAVLLVLGMAALVTVISTARPGSNDRRIMGPSALCGAAFAALALVSIVRNGVPTEVWDRSALACLAVSTATAIVFGSVITAWLQRAAPVSPTRSGWLTGLGAGALGTFVYNLHCPTTTIAYAAIWYGSAVAVSALLGRAIVSRLVRW